MPLADAVAPTAAPRTDAPKAARKIPHLSPLLAALAVGAFALTDEQFAEALDQLRGELAPTTILETILVAMLVEAAEMLRVASRERDKIRAGDVKWVRYRSAAERSFWRALKAFHDGRKPARAARAVKSAESQAPAEAPNPEPAAAPRVEPERPVPADPAPKPAPAAPPVKAQPEPAAITPAPGAAISPAESRTGSKPRPAGESIFLGKSPEVIRNLIAATAPRPNYTYLDISAAPTAKGAARPGAAADTPGRKRPKLRSR